jgi:hypothetical protein
VRFSVNVSFDGHAYVATHPELPQPITALGMLRRRIEAALAPDELIVLLQLDRAARLERDRRRRGGEQGRERAWSR